MELEPGVGASKTTALTTNLYVPILTVTKFYHILYTNRRPSCTEILLITQKIINNMKQIT